MYFYILYLCGICAGLSYNLRVLQFFTVVYKGRRIFGLYKRYGSALFPGDSCIYIPFYFMYMNLTSRVYSPLLLHSSSLSLFIFIELCTEFRPMLTYFPCCIPLCLRWLDFLWVKIFRNFSGIALCLLLDLYIETQSALPLNKCTLAIKAT